MDQKHFLHLQTRLREMIIPDVKRFVRLTIKENTTKEPDYRTDLTSLLDDLEGHYSSVPKLIFAEMRKEVMLKGITDYSEYVAPKEEE